VQFRNHRIRDLLRGFLDCLFLIAARHHELGRDHVRIELDHCTGLALAIGFFDGLIERRQIGRAKAVARYRYLNIVLTRTKTDHRAS
jgi:hypothetical protein